MDLRSRIDRLQLAVHEVLEGGDNSGRLGRIVGAILVGLIFLNVVAVVLESVDDVMRRFASEFQVFLYVSLALFTVEYLLRLWTCTRHDTGLYAHPVKGRLRYMLTPLALVDLVAILPFYLTMFTGLDLRFLRLIRLLWVLKITRYLPAMGLLSKVLRRERRTLVSVMTLMLIILFIASSLVYLLEHKSQPEKFASIPHAMWWGVATLTTVGYGDVVPITSFGKALGMLIMLIGIGAFALPAGVLASAFVEERKRRDFMLTWNLVAQVPAFSFLNAADIARIASLLHPREAMANEVIFHKGEEAGSMFFIVSGEVEAEFQPNPIRMKKGEFFGEVALVFHCQRTASVVALTSAELLELDAKDLHQMFESRPQLRARILDEAERRLAKTQSET